MLSQKPWKADEVIRLLIGLMTTVCGSILFIGALQHFLSVQEAQRKFLGMVVGVVTFQGAALLWVWYFLRQQRITWSAAFGFQSRPFRRVVVYGTAVGVIITPIAWMLQKASSDLLLLLHRNPEAQQSVQLFRDTLSQQSAGGHQIVVLQQCFFAFSVMFVAPFAEEILFRGLLYPTIKQSGFPRLALWGTSFLFALTHVTMATLIPLTVFAVVLVALYELTDNLFAPILAHSLFNTTNLLCMLYERELSKLIPPQ